jgi:acyl carrier protein
MQVRDIEGTIRGFVCQELKVTPDQVADTTDILELSGSESIKLLRIVARIERQYDIELEDEQVFGVRTIQQMVDVVHKLLPDA